MSTKREKLKNINILVFVFTRTSPCLYAYAHVPHTIKGAIEIYGKYITQVVIRVVTRIILILNYLVLMSLS